MSETTNYKLYVTSDSSEKIKTVRERLCGETDSNMVKIDDALGQKADHSVDIPIVLSASGWSGASAPYTYDLAVEDLDAQQNGYIGIAQTATFEERQMASAALMFLIGQEDGVLHIAADGEMPNIDIPVTLILLH